MTIQNEELGSMRGSRVPKRPWPPAGMLGTMLGPLGFLVILIFIPAFIWFGCRIEPRSGEIAILIHKVGEDLPSGQIIAGPKQKGIQLEVLPEGRHWRDPYRWGWKIAKITNIPVGKMGVITRLYGEELPPGEIIAGDNTKGIVAEPLSPGKYRINPYANKVELFDAVNVRPGYVGIRTSLNGQDVLNSKVEPDKRNSFLVGKGMKGVMTEVLNPGTYYLNPYLYDVVEVNLQSQRFAVSGNDAISFLTVDGFTVSVEGTVEFAVEQEKSALLTHRVGDINDIVQKLIVPRMRGFCRLEGSKHPAIDFIVGETRQKFQNDLESHLHNTCVEWGVNIKSVLIRNIIPPDEIASIIRDREVAVQESKKYDREIEQAKSKAELTRLEMQAQQNKEKVEADTARIQAVITANQEKEVKIVAGQREMVVAKIESEAAESQAKAVILKAQADGDVIRMQNTAEANVMKSQVKAFNSGLNFARYVFYKKIGPQIDSILSTDQEQGLGALFFPYLPQVKEVK
jgi:regulator of protease activity HflC (stomatin/prohibitin superfamily)